MTTVLENKWVKFFRNYGPIPTNDNMYDETIQRAILKLKIDPIKLPAQFLEELIENFNSEFPSSIILTGTAGDGKTYHVREVWSAFGGSNKEWNAGNPINKITKDGKELIIIKDLSELAEEGSKLLEDMADAALSENNTRFYLVAANHGQLLEKLKEAKQSPNIIIMAQVVEELLVKGETNHGSIRLKLRDLSRAESASMLVSVIKSITEHQDWNICNECSAKINKECNIWENRSRLLSLDGEKLLHRRLKSLIEISEHNGNHFPVRQILALVTNMILGHPEARDGLLTCIEIPKIISNESFMQGSIYSNIFGDNLKRSRAEKTDVFRKLKAIGIGNETSNQIDGLLVYGSDDPSFMGLYNELVASDKTYGGTASYEAGQKAYLEGYESEYRLQFLTMLRSQRQRLFFTLPETKKVEFKPWDLTVFRYAGMFLLIKECIHSNKEIPNRIVSLIIRGLNRVLTGMLVQNQDELVLAMSGSLSQSKASPLLDEIISVPRRGGEEVKLCPSSSGGIALSVRISKGEDPGLIQLSLTPARFEFLCRVAEGDLPTSFSVECHEDIQAFKAKLLTATERRRELEDDQERGSPLLLLSFIEIGSDGRAAQRRVTIRV